MAIDVEDLVTVCLAMRTAHSQHSGACLDAVMLQPPGSELKHEPRLKDDVAWLGPDTRIAGLLREAFAAKEIEPDFVSILHDADPEIQAVFADLWRRAVVNRFRRAYLGAHQNTTAPRR